MKFVTYLHADKPGWGLLDGAIIADLTHFGPSLKAVIGSGRLAQAGAAAATGKTVPVNEIVYLPPIPDPSRILCIGQNYTAHRDEMGGDRTAHPLIFTRYPSSVSGHSQTLRKPAESDE